MEQPSPRLAEIDRPGYKEAWQMVASQLRMEMRRADYETWVEPLEPVGFNEGTYRLGGKNSYGLDWVESRLRSRITGLLEGVLAQPVQVKFSLLTNQAPANQNQPASQPALIPETAAPALEAPLKELAAEAPAVENLPSEKAPVKEKEAARPPKEKEKGDSASGSPRKIQLQRAYGTERARVIQPERGMFLTNYLFSAWLPLLGHSAFAAILAARSLCYWNPMTGELRNVIETDMSELAKRANVSVRTMKDVLNTDLVKRYFLRYKVRRIMTANGVRTAGIVLQVRMDDPLTPEDQAQHNLPEEDHWYTADFEDETEEE